jgi:hypothetical protein
VLVAPLLVLGLALLVYLVALGLGLVGLEAAGAATAAAYVRLIDLLFQPAILPTILPRLVLLAVAASLTALLAGLVAGRAGAGPRRRLRGAFWWQLIGAPLGAADAIARFSGGLWALVRGAAVLAEPSRTELSRRFTELLGENLGQPGFREVLLLAHDLDARRDLSFALLAEPHRRRFFTRRAGGRTDRQAETVDLAGVGRDHALDALAGALSLPVVTDPALITFQPESYWRGETHRLCDRADAVGRLLEEVAAAGAEQVILVSPQPPPPGPHTLRAGRSDWRGRAGEYVASLEGAALRDAAAAEGRRFGGLFRIRPAHNPIGPFDFAGAYDERSDRRQPLAELIDRGYEDAYRQFIEPIVGGSDAVVGSR